LFVFFKVPTFDFTQIIKYQIINKIKPQKMKKRILLFTAIAAMSSLILSSYLTGPAANGYDCTGAESAGTGAFTNPTGCTIGSGCHSNSATTTITVALELDSAGGVATTHYFPGKTYTIKLTGTNGTGTSYPDYGFQLAVLKGTASAATNSDAGMFATSGLPANTHIQAPGTHTALTVAEHSTALAVTGTSFTQTFSWTAPATNVGSISIWGATNFTNGSTTVYSGDQWNTNHVVIAVWPAAESAANVINSISITAFPNPATTNLNLQMENAAPGTYTLQIFNMNGSTVTAQNIDVSSASQVTDINTSNWAPGVYNVVVEKDGNRKTMIIVKQ
jgi:hypothetical protein